jgi:hypothetical protein
MRNSFDQHRRLAAPRTGKDQKRSIYRKNGTALFGIKLAINAIKKCALGVYIACR